MTASKKYFRLASKVERGALDERTGYAWREESTGSYWGSIMIWAKWNQLICIPDVDVCTAYCFDAESLGPVVHAAKPMQDPKTVTFGTDIAWAIFVSRDWATKYAIPYFEMRLNEEMAEMSFLEYVVTMGGIEPSKAREAAKLYSKPRKKDKITLDPVDVTGLIAAAEAREAAIKPVG